MNDKHPSERIWWIHELCDAGPTPGTEARTPAACVGCGRTDGEWWPGAPIVAAELLGGTL